MIFIQPTKYTFWYKDSRLHYGRFIFRHKGKKLKGRPNYPPTKRIVKSGRQWQRPLTPEMKAELRASRRQWRREYTAAIKKHNRERREARIAARERIDRVAVRTQRGS